MPATVNALVDAARRLPFESLPRLAGCIDAECRDTWTAVLVDRGHAAEELADLTAAELARIIVA